MWWFLSLWLAMGEGVWLGLTASRWAEYIADDTSWVEKSVRYFWTMCLWPLALWHRLDAESKTKAKAAVMDFFK